jgi:hypothetical protein
MEPVARPGYRCVEEPFLRLRKRYVRGAVPTRECRLPTTGVTA